MKPILFSCKNGTFFFKSSKNGSKNRFNLTFCNYERELKACFFQKKEVSLHKKIEMVEHYDIIADDTDFTYGFYSTGKNDN